MIDTTALEQKIRQLEDRVQALEVDNAALAETVRVSEMFAGKTPGWAPLRAVSAVTGVPVHRIIGTRRSATTVEARLAVAHLLARRGMSHSDIADVIRRERSTVSSHLRQPAPTDIIERAERLLGRDS